MNTGRGEASKGRDGNGGEVTRTNTRHIKNDNLSVFEMVNNNHIFPRAWTGSRAASPARDCKVNINGAMCLKWCQKIIQNKSFVLITQTGSIKNGNIWGWGDMCPAPGGEVTPAIFQKLKKPLRSRSERCCVGVIGCNQVVAKLF